MSAGDAMIALHREPTDLAALLRESLLPLATEAKEQRIELRVTTGPGATPLVMIDREKISWCVATLVGNALRYVNRASPGGELGGSVLVAIDHDEASPHRLSVAVHDDGPGIPDAQLPFLFERRPGALQAAGFALLLVRDIVQAHGGEIAVETRRGPEEHGTSITLHIPIDPSVAS